MTTPRQEYLKYLQYLTDQQYDYSDEPEEEKIPDDAWIWADPPEKEKMKNIIFNGVIDATNLRKSEIKKAIGQSKNIKVGNFTIRLVDFYGRGPLDKGTLSLRIYEKRTQTPTGQPCNMDYDAELHKDDRFNGRPWLSYFEGSYGREIPIDTIVDIVKWMQVIKKLTAFL